MSIFGPDLGHISPLDLFSPPETGAGAKTVPSKALHKPLELITWVNSTNFDSVDFKLCEICQTKKLLFEKFVNLCALGGTSALSYLFAFATNHYWFWANLCNKTESVYNYKAFSTELQMWPHIIRGWWWTETHFLSVCQPLSSLHILALLALN